MEFLTGAFAGQPVWLWLAFLSFIGFLLWVDLGLLKMSAIKAQNPDQPADRTAFSKGSNGAPAHLKLKM